MLKKSRIISSIVTVFCILISIFVAGIAIRNSVIEKNSSNIIEGIGYIALLFVVIMLYIFVKKKLKSFVKSQKIIYGYCYLYIVIAAFVSRIVCFFAFKGSETIIEPSFRIGISSYINLGLSNILGRISYANLFINTLMVVICSVLIKVIMTKITSNDLIATVSALMYVLMPNSVVNSLKYNSYAYNLLFILISMYILIHIINKLKDFNYTSNSYLIYSILLGLVISLDILFGGKYIYWLLVLLMTVFTTNYVSTFKVKIKESIKEKLSEKEKKLARKLESINISKLVLVVSIAGLIALVFAITLNSLVLVNKFEFSISNVINTFLENKAYYIIVLAFSVLFNVIELVLKRDTDVGSNILKLGFLLSLLSILLNSNGMINSYIFDTFMVIVLFDSIYNVCLNRQSKIKLLKEKN